LKGRNAHGVGDKGIAFEATSQAPMQSRTDSLAAVLPAETRQRAYQAQSRLAGWAAVALILVWGANFSVQKAVFDAMSPGGFLFVRYLVMPVAAALLLCSRHGTRWPRVGRADLRALLRLGIAGHLLHVGMVTYGIHWSTAFSSSLILAIGPVFTLLILRAHGIERLTRAQVIGVAVAFADVLTFLSDKLVGANWRASGGDLVLLVAAAFFSYYTVHAKPLFERHGGVTVTTYAILLGSAPVVLVSLPAGLQVDWLQVRPAIWAAMLWAVLVSAFLGWMVWGWINAVRGVARTAPLMYLMPPVAGIVAWLVTGERYTAIKLAGAGLTLVGVALAQFAQQRPRAVPLESVTVID
jgi:drug/metabolite transporter (DMT)-like permease